ncbi:MAG: hypothetical protein OES46_13265 [Gammaproteobacteria bacterium]|nr:hypothetical protein [Gammaproteobacteria bacterium]
MSQAQPIPDISKLMRGYYPVDGYPLRLKLPDVEVDVKALNRASLSWPSSEFHGSSRTGTKLLVLLVLSPRADGVHFDPSRVRYQPEGEQTGRPSLLQRPARKRTLAWGHFKTCFSSSNDPDTYAPITGPVPVTKRACFRIFFDDYRAEDRAFTLFIEGISKSGKALEVPSVVFKHKKWVVRQPIVLW